MSKTILWSVVMLAAMALPAAAQPYFAITHIPTIQVAGEGVVSVEPDRARLFMRVSEIRPSVADAKTAVDQKAMQIQKMLTGMGIERNQINASELLIQRTYQEPVPEGRPIETYDVSRQITVTIADVTQLDTILDRSVALGTNQIWQVELFSSREADLKLEAIRLAVQDARRKAGVLAAEIKRTLGNVYMAEHEFGGGVPIYRMTLQEQGGPGDFSRGTIRIEARVSTVFEIE
jgi:uncharacterized protein